MLGRPKSGARRGGGGWSWCRSPLCLFMFPLVFAVGMLVVSARLIYKSSQNPGHSSSSNPRRPNFLYTPLKHQRDSHRGGVVPSVHAPGSQQLNTAVLSGYDRSRLYGAISRGTVETGAPSEHTTACFARAPVPPVSSATSVFERIDWHDTTLGVSDTDLGAFCARFMTIRVQPSDVAAGVNALEAVYACGDGDDAGLVPAEWVGDDYCDCGGDVPGDEAGTGACAGQQQTPSRSRTAGKGFACQSGGEVWSSMAYDGPVSLLIFFAAVGLSCVLRPCPRRAAPTDLAPPCQQAFSIAATAPTRS